MNAAAKLTGATTLRYDFHFRYVKRVCAGTLPLELPVDVNCSAKIAVSAARSIVAEGAMSKVQYTELMARLEAVTPATQ